MSWDSFEDEVKATSGNPLHGCKLCATLSGLDKKDRDALAAVLANPTYSARGIKRGLDARDVRMSPDTIAKHRRGDCK